MLTEKQVKEVVGEINRSILNKKLSETDAIKEITIKAEKTYKPEDCCCKNRY